MIIVGVIQFGVGLNFWLDMQRVANRGVRAAVVNCGVAAAPQCGTNLASYLSSQIISQGNTPSVEICYVPPSDPAPNGWKPIAGDGVRVTLKENYRLQAIVNLLAINLTAKATARLEQDPTSSALPDRTDSTNYVLSAHTGSAACQP